MTLLARKNQLGLASQGAELLKSKREALLKELLALVQPLVDANSRLYSALDQAARSVTFAEALDGRRYLKSLALTSRRRLNVVFNEQKYWGVRVPKLEFSPIKRDVDERGISPSGVTSRALETTGDFEEALEVLLTVVPLHVRLTRLGSEVRRTSRRVNALDQVLIPRLKEDIEVIARALEEMEREDMFRLRRIKKKKRRQESEGNVP